jgi:DNA-binding transcriptional LysR family regulator
MRSCLASERLDQRGLADPGETVDEDDERVEIVDLQGRIPPRVIGLVWHADRHHSPAAEAFVDTAVDVCRDFSIEPAAA